MTVTSSPSAMTLIERLGVAEGGSRELDAEICLLLVPTEAQPNGCWLYWPSKDSMINSVHPRAVTTSLDAALALAERVLGEKAAMFALSDIIADEGNATDLDSISMADLPRLLCIAILRAHHEGTTGHDS